MTTVVATKDSIHSDSRCSFGIPFDTPKIHRIWWSTEEYLVGGAGNPHLMALARSVLQEHGLPNLWKLHMEGAWPPNSVDTDADLDMLVVYNRELWILDTSLIPLQVDQDEYVIGTGSEWYMAARDMGYTLHDSILFAIRKDPGSGGPIHSLRTRSTTL